MSSGIEDLRHVPADLDEAQTLTAGVEHDIPRESHPLTCRDCGKLNLHWRLVEGRWTLYDGDSLHICPARSGEGATRPIVSNKTWVGVGLDGVLAVYDGWRGAGHIGEPVPRMEERVKQWRRAGDDVRIVTSRVHPKKADAQVCKQAIEDWLRVHVGEVLPVTHTKDRYLRELWDSRVIQVIPNTGWTVVEQATETCREVCKGARELVDLLRGLGTFDPAASPEENRLCAILDNLEDALRDFGTQEEEKETVE